MHMYGKVFASLYQGTLRGKAHEILVFTNMLACADKEGCVDKHFRAIADEVGLTVDEVKAAIEVLESPDSESRSPEKDGRRIIRINDHRAWGWEIVNYGKYRAIRNDEERREQNRLAQEKWRNRNQRKPSVSSDNQDKPMEREKEKGDGEGNGIDVATAPSDDFFGNEVPAVKKPRKEASGPHAELIRLWNAAYEEKFNFKYKSERGKDGVAVKALLETGMPALEIIAIAKQAWDSDTFYCKQGRTLMGFNSKFNDIRTELIANGNNRSTHRQAPVVSRNTDDLPEDRPSLNATAWNPLCIPSA